MDSMPSEKNRAAPIRRTMPDRGAGPGDEVAAPDRPVVRRCQELGGRPAAAVSGGRTNPRKDDVQPYAIKAIPVEAMRFRLLKSPTHEGLDD
jgi:hypothetical protein